MSPRIIQLPLPGRDRRYYVAEIRKAEAAYRYNLQEAEAAHAVADRALARAHQFDCDAWSALQFIWFLGRLFHCHELAALLVARGPGRRAAECRLELRPLFDRTFARIAANRLINCYRPLLPQSAASIAGRRTACPTSLWN